MLWDQDSGPGGAVRARWNDKGLQLSSLAWCASLTPDEQAACWLFEGHPTAHGWDVTDPIKEALARELTKEHPHLFPEYNEGEEGWGGV
ncbi:hypothetical protein ACH4KN_00500 [Streptomyces sp. NPDC017546]|uniref:hypothetical protein n=1 Tax=Streptomyces sp. NPDC017546 TaxID=3365001 RepID=UPI003799B184